jgi:carboxypeptidase C (cathepsin A)
MRRITCSVRCLTALSVALMGSLLVVPQGGAAQEGEAPAPERWETSHSIQMGGETVNYDAVVGSITLSNNEGEATGELYYTGYFRTNAPSGPRPLIFSFNGGPGSASFWLHMGIMGPRRVVTPDVGPQGPPPYPLEDNPYTLLDKADIIMLDPIGTGFSHLLGDTPGSEFWGIDEDAASLAQFIRRFLSEHERWNDPRYLLGESYGTTRSAVLAGHLQRANIDLNGIVLVSSVLQFNTIQFAPGDDIPYITNVPSYAVVAEYLDALPDGKPADLEAFMEEVEAWALTDYATALIAGSTLDDATRSRVIDQMHRYTGLSRDFIDKADLRVSAPEFQAELLRDDELQVGRLDARFTGPVGDELQTRPSHDPQSSAISSAYTSAFNAYLRDELGYDGEREYVPSGATRNWNWGRMGGGGMFGRGGGTPNVGPDLANAIRRNPELEVLLINGIYDLATPYFAAVWTMDHLGLPPELRDNIQRADFAAGHMMYVEQSLLPQWKQTLDAFITRTSGARPIS